MIPSELGSLSALFELYLGASDRLGIVGFKKRFCFDSFAFPCVDMVVAERNRLTGTIPSELGSLSELGYLELCTLQNEASFGVIDTILDSYSFF